MNEKQPFLSVFDIIKNDAFISWRLFRTQELEAYWADFLKENPESKTLLQEACQQFDAIKLNQKNPTLESEAKLYEKIQDRIRIYNRNRRKVVFYWLSAASCLLLIIASYLFFSSRQDSYTLSARNEIVGKTLPIEGVRLISGNQTIALKSNTSIALSEEGQVSITDSTSETKALQLTKDKLNKLIVPYGKRSFITLSDGTKVWLNSGTELDFPANFMGNSRDIYVKGEIYIEVAKSTQPFLVHTQQAAVHVLGTKFNISAYADDIAESVVLVEGRVKVESQNQSSLTLQPNEMVPISTQKLTKISVDASEYISWRNGVMEFNKASMAEVLKKVGRYYNVSFENSSDISLNEKTVSGKLFLSSNLDSVMTSVSILSSTDYKRENNHIFIRKK